MSKGHANKTERNNIEYNDNQSIYQAEQMEDGTREYDDKMAQIVKSSPMKWNEEHIRWEWIFRHLK